MKCPSGRTAIISSLFSNSFGHAKYKKVAAVDSGIRTRSASSGGRGRIVRRSGIHRHSARRAGNARHGDRWPAIHSACQGPRSAGRDNYLPNGKRFGICKLVDCYADHRKAGSAGGSRFKRNDDDGGLPNGRVGHWCATAFAWQYHCAARRTDGVRRDHQDDFRQVCASCRFCSENSEISSRANRDYSVQLDPMGFGDIVRPSDEKDFPGDTSTPTECRAER